MIYSPKLKVSNSDLIALMSAHVVENTFFHFALKLVPLSGLVIDPLSVRKSAYQLHTGPFLLTLISAYIVF